MTSQTWPFFYDDVVDEILADRNGRHIVIMPRGAGKSRLLAEIARQCSVSPKTIVSGHTRFVAAKMLEDMSVGIGEQQLCLLIDDYDFLLDPRLAEEPAFSRDKELTRRLENAAWHTATEAWTRGTRVVVTCSDEDPRARGRADFSKSHSDMYQWANPVRPPKPWQMKWTPLLIGAVMARFGDVLGKRELQIAGEKVRFAEPFLLGWIQEALELTGGHPTLLGSALEQLAFAIQNSSASHTSPELPLPASTVRKYIAPHLERTGMHAVRRRLNALRDSADEVERSAFELLTLLANGSASAEMAVDTRGRELQVLERDSLAFWDERTGKASLLGTIMTDAVIGAVKSNLTVTPDRHNPGERGTVTLGSGPTAELVELSGNSWLILKYLHDAAGRRCSVAELREKLGMVSDKSVRSSIQRLADVLAKSRIGPLVQNSYSEGYSIPRSTD